MYERGPLSARLLLQLARAIIRKEGLPSTSRRPMGAASPCRVTRAPAPRLDFSTSYNISDNFTVFFDWTNILYNWLFKSDIVRVNYANGAPTTSEIFPWWSVMKSGSVGGVRFRFGHDEAPAPVAPVALPPPPPPPPPVVEQPAPPPPPPPAPAPTERGERGQ